MNEKGKGVKFLALVLALALIPVSSCSDHSEKEAREWLTERDCAYFETKMLDIASSTDDSAICTLVDACSKEGQISLLLSYSDIKTYEDKGNEIVFLDPEGNVTSRFSLEETAPDFSVVTVTYDLSGRLVVLGKTLEGGYKIIVFSFSGDRIEEEIFISGISYYLADMIPTETGWAFLSYNTITLTDKQGKVTHEEPLVGDLMEGGLFFENGRVMTTVYINGDLAFFSLDLTSLSAVVTNQSDMKWSDDINLLYFDFQGEYASDNQGVYKFDFSSGVIAEIADWNQIDIPPSTCVGVQNYLYVLNDDTMIRNTIPMSSRGNDELIIMIHRDQNPNADKKVLTIGGYASRTDLIERAIYLYNTGDNDYRIELVEYFDIYPYVDAAGISRANAAIITAMSSGCGDDMFVGMEFDYDLWGDSGMVMDLSGLFGTETTLAYDDYLPCLTDLNKHNGKIYKIFPSFAITGYVGYADSIGADNRLTLDRVSEIAKGLDSSQIMFPPTSRTNLTINSILYRLDDFVSNGDFAISDKDLLKIAEYGNTYGTTNSEGVQSIDISYSYATGQLLFQDAHICSPDDYGNLEQSGTSPVHFYGLPSVYDSARICSPSLVISVSSGTEAPDACLDFIRILLSDEVQQYAMDIGTIPVSVDMFEKQISFALSGEDKSSADMTSATGKRMTEEAANQYRECIMSLNCIQYVSIDLWIILRDEFDSYYREGKSISDVREAMVNRVNIYLDEKRN
jgi:hypothetical protein